MSRNSRWASPNVSIRRGRSGVPTSGSCSNSSDSSHKSRGGVQAGAPQQGGGSQDVDDTPAGKVGQQQIFQTQGRFPEKACRPLFLQAYQPALGGPDAGRGNLAVFLEEIPAVFTHPGGHAAQVFEVQKQQALIVRDAGGDAAPRLSRLADARQVPSDVGDENRHPQPAEALGLGLQGTVLPVPVAPATSPCRLPIRGSRPHSWSPTAVT